MIKKIRFTRKVIWMSDSTKVIKFTAIMSIIFGVLTYLVALNMETYKLNIMWIPNDFALTICGGVFASTFVVLICEVRRYLTMKTSSEMQIYYHARDLYAFLFTMKQNISAYLENPEAKVPSNVIDQSIANIQSAFFALQSVNYMPLTQSNLLFTAHQRFLSKTATDIGLLTMYSNEINIAINKIKIRYQNPHSQVTSMDEPLRRVLSYQYDRTSGILDKVDEYLDDIDEHLKGKCDWHKTREEIHSKYINIFDAYDFDKKFPGEN